MNLNEFIFQITKYINNKFKLGTICGWAISLGLWTVALKNIKTTTYHYYKVSLFSYSWRKPVKNIIIQCQWIKGIGIYRTRIYFASPYRHVNGLFYPLINMGRLATHISAALYTRPARSGHRFRHFPVPLSDVFGAFSRQVQYLPSKVWFKLWFGQAVVNASPFNVIQVRRSSECSFGYAEKFNVIHNEELRKQQRLIPILNQGVLFTPHCHRKRRSFCPVRVQVYKRTVFLPTQFLVP